jgi:hypothetical protein
LYEIAEGPQDGKRRAPLRSHHLAGGRGWCRQLPLDPNVMVRPADRPCRRSTVRGELAGQASRTPEPAIPETPREAMRRDAPDALDRRRSTRTAVSNQTERVEQALPGRRIPTERTTQAGANEPSIRNHHDLPARFRRRGEPTFEDAGGESSPEDIRTVVETDALRPARRRSHHATRHPPLVSPLP